MHQSRPLLSASAAGGGGGDAVDSLGHRLLRMVANLCFGLFVLAVLVFTLLAATYSPDDPLLVPSSSSSRLTSFLTSTSSATFHPDPSALLTGDDFLNPSSIPIPADSEAVTVSADVAGESGGGAGDGHCDPGAPLDCADREVHHTMMRSAIAAFPDLRFHRFGKPVVAGSGACDMAWRFRPKDARRAALYKDYRRFEIARLPNCTYTISKIGDYHSGVNARKSKKGKKGKTSGSKQSSSRRVESVVPVVGEAVNDTLPVVESEAKFVAGRYLVYVGGGDRCKSMDHYLWSFLCALGEAQYLNRTLVMDLTVCLNAMHTSSGQNEEGKDFRFYFDFEHLKESALVIDQAQFWADWAKWKRKNRLGLKLVEDFRITPMKLANVKDTLVLRKFGTVEPDNYWYRVCEGETEAVIQRPWHLLWKSRRLLEIVSGIASKLNWDFDSVHIVRGEKAKNTTLWPNLAMDTSPDALLTTLRDKIDNGRHLYIATDERGTSFFDPLKDKYTTHFLNDFQELWGEGSEWYAETKSLNSGVPVEFDGYMLGVVDIEVFLRGKKQIETFNDLTGDCKDGINTCNAAAS